MGDSVIGSHATEEHTHNQAINGLPYSVATAPFEKRSRRSSYIYLLSGFRSEGRPRREIVLKTFYKKSSNFNFQLGMNDLQPIQEIEQKCRLKRQWRRRVLT
jgi:hypothetical protein